MRFRSKGLYVAAAPMILLFLLVGGLRIGSSLTGQNATTDPVRESARPSIIPLMPVDQATQKKLEATTSAQIAAMGAGNYAKALTFADPEFQRSVSPKSFAVMIGQRFGRLTTATATTFDPALGNERYAQLVMSAVGGDKIRQKFAYEFFKHEGRWYVMSCIPEGSPVFPAQPMTSKTLRPTVSGISEF